jgi:hypothetical protein
MSTISASTTTTTAYSVTADTTGTLVLQTGATPTTAVTIDTSQNVGIGTASPSNLLHVSQASSDFQVRVTGTSTANAGSVRAYNVGGEAAGFGMTGSTNSGYGANLGFMGTITNLPQIFLTNNIERMRLNTTGALVLAGGSTSANGIGIAFPATQSASSDANTLDDYEEGTWTPSIGGNATYTNQVGQYTKVGRLVTIVAHLTINSVGTGDIGRVIGVPFANAQTLSSISVGYYAGSLTSYASIYGYLNGSTIDIVATAAGGSASSTDTASFFKNGTDFYFTCTYFAST